MIRHMYHQRPGLYTSDQLQRVSFGWEGPTVVGRDQFPFAAKEKEWYRTITHTNTTHRKDISIYIMDAQEAMLSFKIRNIITHDALPYLTTL